MDRRQVALSVVAEVCGRPLAEIDPGLDLVADLEIDSPKALQLLVTLEEKLEIEIPDEDAARLEKVQDVLDYIEA
ncbi:MAG: acyl carrier protein [Planctomycetota bacterium]|jgi:acyl carrier protein